MTKQTYHSTSTAYGEQIVVSFTTELLPNHGSWNALPPSQRVRTELRPAAPVQPPALQPAPSTNGTSGSIFPVHGIRNDTAKFCYQTPFLQVLFNTLTENDISAWETAAATTLLSKTFFA